MFLKPKLLILLVLSVLSTQVLAQNSLIDSVQQVTTKVGLQQFFEKAEALSSSNPDLGNKLSTVLLERSEDFGSVELQNEARLWLGVSLFSQGKYDSIIQVLEQWEFENEGSPASFELLQRNFYMAVAYYYVGEYRTSVELFLSTVNEPALKSDPKFHGRYLRVLGEVNRAADNLDPALEYLQSALEIAETNLDSVGIAASLNRLGVVYYQKEEHEISEKLLQRSLQVSIAARVTSVISSNFNDLGELYFATEEYEKCLELYEQALNYAQDNDGRINTLNNIARLDWKLGKYNEAIIRAKEALSLADDNNILTYKVDATKIIADSYQDLGQFSEATYFYKEYINFRETLFEEEQRRQIIELETQYQTARKEQEIVSLQQREAVQRERNLAYMIGLIVVVLFLIILLMLFFQIRKNNRKISIQNEKLEELNTTKDKFFSIIAHDLRSPMIALQGVGQKLEYFIKRDKQEKILEIGSKIDRSIDQLNHLLNNLLHWAASQTGGIPHHPEQFDVNQVISENLALYEGLLESKRLTVHQSHQQALVYADKNTVSAIIRNLLSNAIKFSPENGQIWISSLSKNGVTHLEITDQGAGMEQTKIQEIFSQSVKSSIGSKGEKGFGLGLKLTKEFVDQNQGSIDIESQLGEGTKFKLSFPTQGQGKMRDMGVA